MKRMKNRKNERKRRTWTINWYFPNLWQINVELVHKFKPTKCSLIDYNLHLKLAMFVKANMGKIRWFEVV